MTGEDMALPVVSVLGLDRHIWRGRASLVGAMS